MDNKLIQVVIAITVGIVVLGSLLVPVITDASTTEKTFTNEGYYRMTHYSSTDVDEVTLEWSHDNPNTFIVNGENYDISATKPVSVIIDTDLVLRAGFGSGGVVNNVGYFKGDTNAIYAESNQNHSLSFTFSGGSYTGTIRGTSVSGTYTDLYVPDPKGQYIMKDSTKSAYILEDTEIIAFGITDVKKSNNTIIAKGISITGTVDNVTANVWRGASDFTLSTPEVYASEVDGMVDLYTIEKITLTGTVTETIDESTVTTDTAITYSYFLVPYQVTAELSQHLDTSEIGLLAVIPVLMIVAFLVFAVRIFGENRD